MKLEYLHEGSSDCPLIRLFEFKTTEIKYLHVMLSDLAGGKRDSVILNDLTFVESVDGCYLAFMVSKTDKGISLSSDLKFECHLTSDGWLGVAGLIAPFMNDIKGFQWLDETGTVSLLISVDGKW